MTAKSQQVERFSASVPARLFSDMEKARKQQASTRSEFVRTLFRAWSVNNKTPVKLSSADLRAVEEGRNAVERGDFTTLKDLHAELGGNRR